MDVTWIGHGTVLVETDGVRLLLDPVLGRRVGMLRRLAPPVDPALAERIDALLITHLHGDHADAPSLRRVARDVPAIAPPAAAAWLRARRFSDVRELRAGAIAEVGPVAVEATHAAHDGRRWPYGPAAAAVGFLITGSLSAYCAGDTALFPEMADLAGRVDVALIPIWGWGPTLGPGHLDPERAARAVAMIAPRVVVPIHWGTLGLPWARPSPAKLREPAARFADAAARLAPEVDVRVLEPGERASFGVVPAPRPQA
jgi:L-ascorbate metabolism protein UlaG (beta-lactamase superfamily)